MLVSVVLQPRVQYSYGEDIELLDFIFQGDAHWGPGSSPWQPLFASHYCANCPTVYATVENNQYFDWSLLVCYIVLNAEFGKML